MIYKCPDCGKIYNYKPTYCECGNEKFICISNNTKSLRKNGDKKSEKKDNPFFLLTFLLILLVGIACGLYKILNYKVENTEGKQAYINKIQKIFFEKFDPQGITKSGYCIIYFSVDEHGNIYNRKFLRKSDVFELDSKVAKLMKNFSSFDVPPESAVNKPLYFEFNCSANDREVGCYSKPYKGKTQ